MGCDIHFVVEKKAATGRWVGVHASDYGIYDGRLLSKRRNYCFFAELASVRGESSQGRQPLGLPKDMSDLTDLIANGPTWTADGHSFSYISAPEFLSAYRAALISEIQYYRSAVHPIIQKSADELEKRLKEIDGDPAEFCNLMLGFYPSDDPVYGEKEEDFRVVFWFDN